MPKFQIDACSPIHECLPLCRADEHMYLLHIDKDCRYGEQDVLAAAKTPELTAFMGITPRRVRRALEADKMSTDAPDPQRYQEAWLVFGVLVSTCKQLLPGEDASL